MAGIFNDDESTDDEFSVNLHLAERLRINRGENSNFMEDRKFESTKDLKQYCNMRRKKFAQDGQSSSSSSLELHNDHPTSGLISADIYPNKKRQNGDKNTEQLANPKRTCLSDRFCRSPDWRELRKKTSNLEIQTDSYIPDSYYIQSSASPDLFPVKKSEDNVNSLADAEDSDFEIPIKSNRSIKMENGQSSKLPKHQSVSSKMIQVPNQESKPSTSYFSKFLESGSEDESKTAMQNGALKGGRQESTADHTYYAKRLFGRKVNKKLLDSDESEDDNSMAIYRSRPLVYSSSDSEDFKQNTTKSKHTGATSNGPANHSHSYVDGFDKNTGHRSRQFKSFRPNPKFSKKTFNSLSGNRADSSDGYDRHSHVSDIQRKNMTHRACRTRRSPRINMAANLTSNVFTNGNNVSVPVRGRRTSGGERGGRRSGSPHHKSIRCQHKTDDSKCGRGRSASASRTQKEKTSYAARYPDVFDAEESDNEFFTANSYSDTETSTESLGGLTINTTFPNHSGLISCTINCEDNFEDITDDEISVVFSTGPYGRNGESRRGTSRTLGRRHSRGTPHRQLQNAREVVSLSPDPVEQVRQMEEDERMARMLQAQFDAEVDADYVPTNHTLLEHEDSDDEILDPIGDSDSDSGNPINYSQYAISLPINRRGFGLNRYSNRAAPSTAIFLGRRVDSRNRRRSHFQTPRERIENPFTRIFHLGIPDISSFFDGDHYEALLSLDMDGEPRGLPKSEINRLPTRVYIHPNSAASSSGVEVTHKRTELNKECQVCLTDYENGDILRILPCFHEFHTPCIDPWLSINHTCPVCRVTVDLDA